MLQQLFFEYAPAILLLPLIISIWLHRKLPAALKNITYYLIISAITEILSFYMWKHSINNYPLLHIYTFIEYLVILRFYHGMLNHFLPGSVFIIFMILIPAFFIFDSFYLENIYIYNTYSRSIEALVIIFLAMTWFVRIVTEEPSNFTRNNALKFINSAFLIYFSGSIVLFSFGNSISASITQLGLGFSIWVLHTLLAVIEYILFAIGLWKYRKQ